MSDLPPNLGIIVVDHGSKRPEANDMLDDVVRLLRKSSGAAIVEPAHMELAEPTIAQAFERCVSGGARSVVIQPYFLAPGRHSTTDIPRMAAEAAADFPDIPFIVADPLGIDERLAAVMLSRIRDALDSVDG